MGEGRSKALWNHTSSIWALFIDIYRDPKEKARFKLADFNPHLKDATKKAKKPDQTISMRELHAMMPNLPDEIATMAKGRKPRG